MKTCFLFMILSFLTSCAIRIAPASVFRVDFRREVVNQFAGIDDCRPVFRAERELLQAIEILPERLYPYYLLAKLYAESEFYQEDKFRAAAGAVLTKEPKVESTAVREMRTEIKKMVEKGDVD